MNMKRLAVGLFVVFGALIAFGYAQAPLKVYAVYATPIEEPWDGVIHAALLDAEEAGLITYDYVDDLGYAGDFERVLAEVAEEDAPDAIFGDAFGNEEAVRRVARDYPDIAFAFGSGLGPSEPNFAVFDNWIHEPAYLSGLIAGTVSESGVIGVVGGFPVPEVNRIVQAFIVGVKEANEDATVLISFINSWFDPPAAKEAALAQLDAGADVLFAERFGVIEAAAERGAYAFGNMSDQNDLAPETVLTGPVWHLEPLVRYVIDQVNKDSFTAQDLKDFTMMGKGGASLAPLHGHESWLPAELVELVREKEAEIISGLFRVPINEETPTTTR